MSKQDDSIFRAFVVFWMVSALLSLVIIGVGIWGFVELVNWGTSQ